MECKFKAVLERDMDMLILEEFACSQKFADLFFSEVSLLGAEVIEIQHSRTDTELGESDITVMVSFDGKKHALLIEDKVNAVAMPDQCERYRKRGEKGVRAGEYEDFSIFITAPEKYISENSEACKYPNKVTYETILNYFEMSNDARSNFKI